MRWFVFVLLAFAAGLAWGQGGDEADGEKESLQERLKKVRREVKVIELKTAVDRVPGIVAREKEYFELVRRMEAEAKAGKDITPLLEKGRSLKLAALNELNEILRRHKGKFAGLSEQKVWERLRNARWSDVSYEEEWLVNILDDIEEAAGVNIEMDARIYKFDTVSFQFDKTSARAMLQMMADTLLFNWLVRGDTIYVYKERNEILFGGEWLRQKKKAWRERKKALEEAAKEAERRALEGDDK